MQTLLFRERQRFNQTWLFIIVILSGMLPAVIVFMMFLGNLKSDTPMTVGDVQSAILLSLLLTTGMILFLRIMMLEVKITTDSELYYKFSPFQIKYRLLKPADIKSYQVKEYKPLAEYGGWGIRYGGPSKGTAYTVSGNIGVYFEMVNGKKLLIGTQKQHEFLSVLNSKFKK